MKNTISATIIMLVAISYSSAYAESGDPRVPIKTGITQQQVQQVTGTGHQMKHGMDGQMKGGMGKCMSAAADTTITSDTKKAVHQQEQHASASGHQMMAMMNNQMKGGTGKCMDFSPDPQNPTAKDPAKVLPPQDHPANHKM